MLPVRWMRGTLLEFPGNANLPIGGFADANRVIGVPRQTVLSVPEMAHAAEHHGHAQPVRRGDDVRIAH